MCPHLRLKLQTVVTKEAEKNSNPYALSHFLNGLQNAEADINEGYSVARALYDNFNGRLLTKLERAAGVPVTYGGGAQDKGRPA